MLDSLARYANALREIAIATGESTGRGGYPPSVFARVARTLEIAGAAKAGAITAIVTVLDDGDERDPVSDAARSLLDGHFALSPKLARAGHFPAIDICASASRTMSAAAAPEHQQHACLVRDAIAYLERTEEMRSLGIIPNDVRTQLILASEWEIQNFLRQSTNHSEPTETLERLEMLAKHLEQPAIA
jgi:flagellar biosynthesis/type III secretory pathway ATPase